MSGSISLMCPVRKIGAYLPVLQVNGQFVGGNSVLQLLCLYTGKTVFQHLPVDGNAKLE